MGGVCFCSEGEVDRIIMYASLYVEACVEGVIQASGKGHFPLAVAFGRGLSGLKSLVSIIGVLAELSRVCLCVRFARASGNGVTTCGGGIVLLACGSGPLSFCLSCVHLGRAGGSPYWMWDVGLFRMIQLV